MAYFTRDNEGGGSVLTVSSANYTFGDSDGVSVLAVSAGSSNRVITLPGAAANPNRIITIKKVDSGVGLGAIVGTIDSVSGFILADQDDVITIISNSTAWISLSKAIGSQVVSRVKDEVGAGHGSTNTRIRRIETNVVNTGNAITRAVSSTLGNSYTINQGGLYTMAYSDYSSASGVIYGISVNSNQLTTSISSITAANRLSISNVDVGFPISQSVTRRLSAGDVIRPHTDAVPNTTDVLTSFSIEKVGL